MTDYATARKNMVESQIRPSDVTDRRIIRAMSTIAREAFVPPSRVAMAYSDEAVPLTDDRARGQPARRLMSPRTFAKMLVLADLEASDRVLVVGAGTGYSAAVVASIATSVVALESDPVLIGLARTGWASLPPETLGRISAVEAALTVGAADRGPFNVIIIEGAIPERPNALLQQLADGGRCVGVLRRGTVGHATVWRRVGQHFAEADAFDASVGELPGFAQPASFAL